MPQDAFTLLRGAAELNGALAGGRINRINQPSKEEVSFVIYTGKRTVKLLLNVNASDCGVYFNEEEQENPLVAPNFCMLLRKHLQGAEILEVKTCGFERILVFRLRCTSDFSSCERELYAEIMGKYSNLILTENGVILGALKTTTLDGNSKRMIVTGVKYALPEAQEKVNPENIAALRKAFPSPVDGRTLFLGVAGLAPCTAEEIVSRYRGGDFAQFVHHFIFFEPASPCVLFRGGKPVDFFAYQTEGGTPFETLSEAQTCFYGLRRAEKSFSGARQKLLSAVNGGVKKHEKRLAQILEKYRECEDAEENRIKGELLTANLYRLEKGMRSCELENYYDGTSLKILLDGQLTPAQNAQNYYKRYRKQKRTVEALLPQESELKAELDYLESLRAAVSTAGNSDDLKCLEEELLAAGLMKASPEKGREKNRKKKAEIPFRSFEKAGFCIYAGRNNLQNDRLIKWGAPEDVWLHAQKYHSCHVLIKTEGRTVPDEVLLYAAGVCARYSDGKGDRIPVDYCPLKHVKKPPRAKAGFVIYNEYKTVLTDPVEE